MNMTHVYNVLKILIAGVILLFGNHALTANGIPVQCAAQGNIAAIAPTMPLAVSLPSASTVATASGCGGGGGEVAGVIAESAGDGEGFGVDG